MNPTDKELVSRIVRHDEDAFEDLYARYEAPLRGHLTKMVQDPHAAADLLHEVFFRVWTKAEQWTASGSFKSWLYRVATNLALNHLRSLRRRRETPFQTPGEAHNDEDGTRAPSWMVDAASSRPDIRAQEMEHRERL